MDRKGGPIVVCVSGWRGLLKASSPAAIDQPENRVLPVTKSRSFAIFAQHILESGFEEIIVPHLARMP